MLKLLGLQPREMWVVNTIKKMNLLSLYENGVKFPKDRDIFS